MNGCKKYQTLPKRWPRSTIIHQSGIDFGDTNAGSVHERLYNHRKTKSLDVKQMQRYYRDLDEQKQVQKRQRRNICLEIRNFFTNLFRYRWSSQVQFEGRCVNIGNRKETLLDQLDDIDPAKIQIRNFESNKYKTAKYTLLNFIPYNLAQQFKRIANVYFAVSLGLTVVLPDAPIDPTTWIISLVFVVCITMIKQGYEDYLRHKKDLLANNRWVQVVRKSSLMTVRSKDIVVGDLIRILENDTIPCDAVVLSTSHDYGQCYVMTASLDGETSLKTKMSSKLTKAIRTQRDIQQLRGYVECEPPNPELHNFLGRMTIGTQSCPLTNDNLLISGTQLKNTREVLGLCVYTGPQTKMSLNSKIMKNKFSTVEKALNKYLLFYGIVMILEIVICTMLSMAFGVEYGNGMQLNEWYLGSNVGANVGSVIVMALIWFTMFNYIIPISLYVTLEIQRVISCNFFRWDLKMTSDCDSVAICNSSDINDELGLVTHLFTDKTGTLTTNVMAFRVYVTPDLKIATSFNEEPWSSLIMVLTMCHSVQVETNNFVASSPDEKTLLEACREAGFLYQGETIDGTICVAVRDSIHRYRKLDELEFDSYRKCMSVIVRDLDDGTIRVLTKGAESVMLNSICDSASFDSHIRDIIDGFATRGLRTLVMAEKILSESEFEQFQLQVEIARSSIVNRQKFVREAYKFVEWGMTFCGATGIEDRLQEDVVETLNSLHHAGIFIWMLTGDKKETALSIGQSCGLVPDKSRIIELTNFLTEKDANCVLKQVAERNTWEQLSRTVLILDGRTLSFVTKTNDDCRRLAHVFDTVSSVIACRLSPIQKSLLIRMVKENDPSAVTAAIGDGDNDVSMIQEANVGLGIIGMEGKRATDAADFAFSKFKFLKRTLLVHGHWFYDRSTYLIQYSFYKNVVCFTCQFIMAFHSNYSATSLYSGLFLFGYNTLYTSAPVLVYGLLEQNLKEDALMSRPSLYRRNRKNRQMDAKHLGAWFCLGLWQSFVIYYGWFYVWQSSFSDGNVNCLGLAMAETCVLVTNLQVLLDSNFWNWPLLTSIVISLVGFLCLTLLLETWHISNIIVDNYDELRTYNALLASVPKWWITLILLVIALLPIVAYKAANLEVRKICTAKKVAHFNKI